MAKNRNNWVSRLGWLFVNRVVTVLLPVATLAAVTHVGSLRMFGVVAVGQSIGAVGAIVLDYGWAISGPPLVAGKGGAVAREAFRDSIAARLWFGLPAVGLTAVLLMIVGYDVLGILGALSTLLGGFGAAWYFVGRGEGRNLVFYDTGPRLVCALVGFGAGLALSSVEIVVAAQVLGAAAAAVISTVVVLPKRELLVRESISIGAALRILREHRHSAMTLGMSSLYVSAPVTLLAIASPAAVGVFASTQRVVKLVLVVARPVRELFQNWVPGGGDASLRARMRRSLVVTAGMSFILGVSVALLIGPFTHIFSDTAPRLSAVAVAAIGVSVAATVGSQVVGLVCLASLGAFSAVMWSTVVGAVVGLGGVVGFGSLWADTGAWLAIAAAELSVLAYQIWSLRRIMRTWPERAIDGGASLPAR